MEKVKEYCIYTLTNDDFPNDIYVGSTSDFNEREQGHKNRCNNLNYEGYNFKVYRFIREHGGFEKWTMEPIEECGLITEAYAKIREEYWRVYLFANLNSKKAYQTEEQRKEYIKEYNAEHQAEFQKKFREKNPEKFKESQSIRSKKYYEKNAERIICECGCEIRRYYLTKHKKTDKHKNSINGLKK